MSEGDQNLKKMNHDEIVIHIDKKVYKTSNPTTGSALYVLGGVNPVEYDLYLEAHGNGQDDIIVNNNEDQIVLESGNHYYTAQKNLNPGA